MRLRGKVDRNQPIIVKELRQAGYSVFSLADLGNGVPDICVSRAGSLAWLFEIKDGNLPPSKRRLTDDERAWHAAWGGQVNVIESTEEALEIIRKGKQ